MKILFLNQKILFGLVLLSGAWAQAKTLVVSSQKFSENQIDSALVKEAFLGRSAVTKNGFTIKAIDRQENDAKTRAHFIKSVLGWNTTRYKAFWSQIVFTGKGEALPVASSVSALAETLDRSPGSISFVDDTEKTQQMKVLLTID